MPKLVAVDHKDVCRPPGHLGDDSLPEIALLFLRRPETTHHAYFCAVTMILHEGTQDLRGSLQAGRSLRPAPRGHAVQNEEVVDARQQLFQQRDDEAHVIIQAKHRNNTHSGPFALMSLQRQ